MDKFDEMAVRMLGIDRRPPDELLGDGDDHGTMSVRELAAALRETDRRAREEERARCVGICHAHVLAMDEQYKSERSPAKRMSAIGQMGAAEILRDAIRSPEPEAGGEGCSCGAPMIGKPAACGDPHCKPEGRDDA